MQILETAMLSDGGFGAVDIAIGAVLIVIGWATGVLPTISAFLTNAGLSLGIGFTLAGMNIGWFLSVMLIVSGWFVRHAMTLLLLSIFLFPITACVSVFYPEVSSEDFHRVVSVELVGPARQVGDRHNYAQRAVLRNSSNGRTVVDRVICRTQHGFWLIADMRGNDDRGDIALPGGHAEQVTLRIDFNRSEVPDLLNPALDRNMQVCLAGNTDANVIAHLGIGYRHIGNDMAAIYN